MLSIDYFCPKSLLGTMTNRIKDHFLNRFQKPPLLIHAPGRFNLIGEHTDYNLGFVMPGAISNHLCFALALNGDARLFEFEAMDVDENCRFTIDNILAKKEVSWDSYVQAVLHEMLERGHAVQGIQCIFGGDIPIGAGLSSSAALCCGLAYGVSVLQNLKIDKKEIALIGQAAEHRIGLNCGLMDQYAVLFGQADHLLCLDCRSLEFQLLPLQLEGHSLVLLNSKVKHQLAAGSGYNERRRSCENVVATLRLYNPALKSLRDVPSNMLKANETLLDPKDCKRARYVLNENERVMRMVEALQNNDISSIGDLLNQSHEGLRREYEVTVPEIDLLVDLAQKETGVLGARMVGGGFGGCTLNLIKTAEKDAVLQRISEAYLAETGIQPDIIEVRTGRGVHEI